MWWFLARGWFLLRAKLAERRAQVELNRSGLGQPPGREIGDDL
jgi:hypothetical protein